MPRTPLDCTSAMQMRMSRRLCQRSIDSSTRKNFPLFSQQSVTGYVPAVPLWTGILTSKHTVDLGGWGYSVVIVASCASVDRYSHFKTDSRLRWLGLQCSGCQCL